MFSSAALQIIALLTMTIDHIGYYLLDNNPYMRIIGRIAMPLFVFMLVEGFVHTSSRKKYFLRILLTALIAEIPFFLFYRVLMYPFAINLLFNFLISFIVLLLIEKNLLFLLLSPIAILLAQVMNIEYGGAIIIMAIGFYLANKLPKTQELWREIIRAISMLLGVGFFNLFYDFKLEWFALLAILPIMFYSGKKGKRLPRYFMYIYYPAHLLVLFIITALIAYQ